MEEEDEESAYSIPRVITTMAPADSDEGSSTGLSRHDSDPAGDQQAEMADKIRDMQSKLNKLEEMANRAAGDGNIREEGGLANQTRELVVRSVDICEKNTAVKVAINE